MSDLLFSKWNRFEAERWDDDTVDDASFPAKILPVAGLVLVLSTVLFKMIEDAT